MVVEHPYEKKMQDVFRKVAVELQITGQAQALTGIVHVENGLRLSDHLNRDKTNYLIVTDVVFEEQKREVIFIRKEHIKVIFPV